MQSNDPFRRPPLRPSLGHRRGLYTQHARTHLQQRSLPEAVIDLLLDFGAAEPAGGGCERYSFTRRAWRRAAAYLGGGATHYERYRHAYIVMAADSSIVTAAYTH